LHDTGAIAQVQENHATMIPAAVYPSTQGDSFSNILASEVAAIIGSHGGRLQFLAEWIDK
jgi:hypothetical protein